MSRIQLTVLDLYRSLPETLSLVREAERLGFARYWLTEHQPQPSPLTLLPLLAGRTRRIRVGTAGILLRYHAPPRAAYDFQLLGQLFPDRIDAGVCGGFVGGELEAEFRCGEESSVDPTRSYAERVDTFCKHLRLAGSPRTASPEVWLLGSAQAAAQAARQEASFGYPLFLARSRDDVESVDLYRRECAARGHEPGNVAVAVAGLCADTDADATAICKRFGSSSIRPTVVGSPERCADLLHAVSDRYGTKEIAFMDLGDTYEARLRSCELLATALETPSVAAAG